MEDLSNMEARELVQELSIDALVMLSDAVSTELQKRGDTIVPIRQPFTLSEDDKWLIRYKWADAKK